MPINFRALPGSSSGGVTTAIDLASKGGDPTGATSSTPGLTAAKTALALLPGGTGIINIGPGTFAFDDTSVNPGSGNTFQGAGKASVMKVVTPNIGLAGSLIFAGNISDFALLDITIDCAGIVQPIYLVGCRNFCLRLRLLNLIGIGVELAGCEDAEIEIFGQWASNTNTPPTFIRLQHCRNVNIIRPTVSAHLGVGLDLRDCDGTKVENPSLDGQWFMIPARYTGSGGTVTYPTATTITDTAQPFTGASPAISSSCTLRALPIRLASTPATTYEARRILKTGATFVSSGVKEGDRIETGTVWTMVKDVLDEITLAVDGWRNLTDNLPAATPTSGNFITYRTLVSHVVSIVGTTITHGTFTDLDGTYVTPSPGTRYDICYNQGSHIILADTQCRNTKIQGGLLQRGWGDQIYSLGKYTTVEDTTIEWGQDIGIDLELGYGHSVKGVITRKNGTSGVWAPTDSVIDAECIDDGWYNFDTGLGMVTVIGNRSKVSGRFIKRDLTKAKYPVMVRAYAGNVDSTNVVDIHASGFGTTDVGLYPSNGNVTNTKVASLADATNVPGPGTVTGTRIPA